MKFLEEVTSEGQGTSAAAATTDLHTDAEQALYLGTVSWPQIMKVPHPAGIVVIIPALCSVTKIQSAHKFNPCQLHP